MLSSAWKAKHFELALLWRCCMRGIEIRSSAVSGRKGHRHHLLLLLLLLLLLWAEHLHACLHSIGCHVAPKFVVRGLQVGIVEYFVPHAGLRSLQESIEGTTVPSRAQHFLRLCLRLTAHVAMGYKRPFTCKPTTQMTVKAYRKASICPVICLCSTLW